MRTNDKFKRNLTVVHVEPEVEMYQKKNEVPPKEVTWPELQELPKRDSVLPFTYDLFPQLLGDYCRDNSERMMGCPPDYFGAALVVGLASAVGARAVIYPRENDESWKEEANLSGIVIGPPGTTKSSAVEMVLSPIFNYQHSLDKLNDEIWDEYEKELREHARKMKMYDKLIQQGNPAGPEPIKPIEPIQRRVITSHITVEKLGVVLRDNVYGILRYYDELKSFFTHMDNPKFAADREFTKQAMNGHGKYYFDSLNRGSTTVANMCLSVFGCMNDDTLIKYIAKAQGGDNDGMIQRLPVAVMPDDPNEIMMVDRPPSVDHSLIDDLFNRLFDTTGSFYMPFRKDPDNHTLPGAVHFDPEAQVRFNQFLLDNHKKTHDNKLSPALKSHFSKYRKLVASLSLIFHMVDHYFNYYLPLRDNPKLRIKPRLKVSLESLEYALRWAKYLESHTYRIYDISTSDEKVAVEELVRRIKSGKLTNGMTVRDIKQKGWSNLKDDIVIMDSLHYLESLGWLRLETNQKLKSVKIEINPEIQVD